MHFIAILLMRHCACALSHFQPFDPSNYRIQSAIVITHQNVLYISLHLSGGGHLIAWHWGIWWHMDSASASAALILIAFDVAVISVQESERGSSTQSSAALDGANLQICASPGIINGERRAIERVRCSRFDALQKFRHSAAVRKCKLRLSAGSARLALHRKAVGRILDRSHRLCARRWTISSVRARLIAVQLEQWSSSRSLRNRNQRNHRRLSRRHWHCWGSWDSWHWFRCRRLRWCYRWKSRCLSINMAQHGQKSESRCNCSHHLCRTCSVRFYNDEMN